MINIVHSFYFFHAYTSYKSEVHAWKKKLIEICQLLKEY